MIAIARSMITGNQQSSTERRSPRLGSKHGWQRRSFSPSTSSSSSKDNDQQWTQQSVRPQLETNTFDPATLPAIIDPRAMMVIKIKIATSRTLRENPSTDWQHKGDMETFLKALEEVFAESDSDRFETATVLWKNWSHDLRYSLEVDQGNMDNFSRIVTRAIVDKHHVVTSQHVLYYCTYSFVSLTCTVHCTYYTYCTLYTPLRCYLFPCF